MPLSSPHVRTLLVVAALGAPATAAAQVDVLTHRYDTARSGANLRETTLNASNVNNTTFGKLAFRIVDGNIYAQPLIVSGAEILRAGTPPTSAQMNVAIVATSHNSVYAFDADDTTPEPGGQPSTRFLWHTGPSVLGTSVEATEVGRAIGHHHCQDLTTEVGITATPAIGLDTAAAPKRGVIFVVAKSKAGSKHVYKLFALSLADGKKVGEIAVAGEVPGEGFGSRGFGRNKKIRFDAMIQLNRPALLLQEIAGPPSRRVLWVGFGGHCDRPRDKHRSYHGWIFAYDVTNAAAPKLLDALNTTPNGRSRHLLDGGGGVWMSGHGPAEVAGDVYFVTGDGTYDPPRGDLGNSVIKARLVNDKIQVQDWFSPQNRDRLLTDDADLGSVGAVPLPSSHLMLAAGKEGRMYLIDRDAMGKGATPSLDSFQVTSPPVPRDRCADQGAKPHECHYYNIHGAPVIWPRSNHTFVYVNGEEDPLKQYRLVPDAGPGGPGWRFDSAAARKPFDPLPPLASSCRKPGTLDCISAPFPNFPAGMFDQAHMVVMPGGFLSLSANGDDGASGIVWAAMPLAENANKRVVRGVLRAFDASDATRQLWDSESTGNDNDKVGQFAKYNPPVIANGKVYVATFQQEIVRTADDVHLKMEGGDMPALVIYGLKK